MNLAVGTLTFAGCTFILLGCISRLWGVSLLAPYIITTTGYFLGGNTCFLLALIVDKFEKRS